MSRLTGARYTTFRLGDLGMDRRRCLLTCCRLIWHCSWLTALKISNGGLAVRTVVRQRSATEVFFRSKVASFPCLLPRAGSFIFYDMHEHVAFSRMKPHPLAPPPMEGSLLRLLSLTERRQYGFVTSSQYPSPVSLRSYIKHEFLISLTVPRKREIPKNI